MPTGVIVMRDTTDQDALDAAAAVYQKALDMLAALFGAAGRYDRALLAPGPGRYSSRSDS